MAQPTLDERFYDLAARVKLLRRVELVSHGREATGLALKFDDMTTIAAFYAPHLTPAGPNPGDPTGPRFDGLPIVDTDAKTSTVAFEPRPGLPDQVGI